MLSYLLQKQLQNFKQYFFIIVPSTPNFSLSLRKEKKKKKNGDPYTKMNL